MRDRRLTIDRSKERKQVERDREDDGAEDACRRKDEEERFDDETPQCDVALAAGEGEVKPPSLLPLLDGANLGDGGVLGALALRVALHARLDSRVVVGTVVGRLGAEGDGGEEGKTGGDGEHVEGELVASALDDLGADDWSYVDAACCCSIRSVASSAAQR